MWLFQCSLIVIGASRYVKALPLGNEGEEDFDQNSALVLIIVISVMGSLIFIGLLSVSIVAMARICISKRSKVRLENSIPGSLDDEFEIEERLSELSPNEQHLYRAGQEFVKQSPPNNEELSLSNHLLIQEKGIEAWEFIPDANLPSDAIYVNNKTEIAFMSYDYQCSIQANLPISKINDVYYYEAKIFNLDSPEDTIVSIGLSTKPYPYFRLPGRHLYSVTYDSNGSRRSNNSFRLTGPESSVFPALQQGDVVGIGYRCRSGTIFFTRNGKKLSEKSIGGHIKGMKMNNIYPIIGANNPCSIHVNLGQYGFVFIEANIKKWGYALKEGTRPPLPDYNYVENDLLLESSNEDEDDVMNPPDFYETAGYLSPATSKTMLDNNDNITLSSLPPEPPTYKEEDSEDEEELLSRNTERNQFIDADEPGEAESDANSETGNCDRGHENLMEDIDNEDSL